MAGDYRDKEACRGNPTKNRARGLLGVKSVPDTGYENNIMSTSRMRPSEADFLHIMNDRIICH